MPWEFLMSSWWTNVKLQKPCAVSFARRFSLSPQQAEAARVWNKQSAAVFVCLMEDMLTTWVYHGLPSKKGHEWTSGAFFLGMIPLYSTAKVMSTCLLLVLHHPSFGKQSRMSVVQRRDACPALETMPAPSSAGG